MGTCQLALGRSEQARQAFAQARDHDALAVRADTRINRIVMEATLESGGQVRGVDAAGALSSVYPDNISGEELFYEHVHFTVEGNFTLARMVADQVSSLLPSAILESETEKWLEQETCNLWLGLTSWDEFRLWQSESQRITSMPFISQTSHPRNKEYIDRQKRAIKSRHTSSTGKQDLRLYEDALERTPEDPYLVGNYAQFLDATGNTGEAIKQAERFCALLPDLAWTHYYMGALLAKTGRHAESRESLETALELRGDFTMARELLKQLQ